MRPLKLAHGSHTNVCVGVCLNCRYVVLRCFIVIQSNHDYNMIWLGDDLQHNHSWLQCLCAIGIYYSLSHFENRRDVTSCFMLSSVETKAIFQLAEKKTEQKREIQNAWIQPPGVIKFKGRGMSCAKVTHLNLTNPTFCVLCVRMNHFEMHLMFSSRAVDSKVLRMAIYFFFLFYF